MISFHAAPRFGTEGRMQTNIIAGGGVGVGGRAACIPEQMAIPIQPGRVYRSFRGEV